MNMATEIHKKLTGEHGTEVADRMIGQDLQASIAHKDIIEKWGRFPHRCGADLSMRKGGVCWAVSALVWCCLN